MTKNKFSIYFLIVIAILIVSSIIVKTIIRKSKAKNIGPSKKQMIAKIKEEIARPVIAVEGKIVFKSNRGGRGMAFYLLEDGKFEKLPWAGSKAKFSGDGTRILCYTLGDKFRGFYIIDLSSRKKEKLALSNMFSEEFFPSDFDWSPDGRKIVFSVGGHEKKVYAIDIDGSNLKQVTDIEFSGYSPSPQWSPDGKKILLSSAMKSKETGKWVSSPFIFDLSTNKITSLLEKENIQLGMVPQDATWSPDGKKIVFISMEKNKDKYSSREVFIMNTDGTGLRRLTHNIWQEASPVFSPNGNQICFVSYRHEIIAAGSELFVINLDGTGEARLTPPQKLKGPAPFRNWATDDCPDWHQ